MASDAVRKIFTALPTKARVPLFREVRSLTVLNSARWYLRRQEYVLYREPRSQTIRCFTLHFFCIVVAAQRIDHSAWVNCVTFQSSIKCVLMVNHLAAPGASEYRSAAVLIWLIVWRLHLRRTYMAVVFSCINRLRQRLPPLLPSLRRAWESINHDLTPTPHWRKGVFSWQSVPQDQE